MADIKTKDAVKGTIKTIDKAATLGQRMKQAYVQTKEKAEHSTHAQENSAEEYAADRVEGGVDRVTHEAVYQFGKQGRKGVETTKQNISKARDGIRQFKEKRAAEALKNQSVRTPTSIKTTKQAAKAAQKTAQATAKAAQRAAQAAKATAKAVITGIKAAVKATVAAVKAIIAATKALIAAIAAGGWIAVVVIIVICLIALLLGSVFGIFFRAGTAERV